MEAETNEKYKAAVASLQLTDFDSQPLDIRYDLDNNGFLTYEIQVGGPELDAIKDRFNVAGQRVVIVRQLLSVYYLAEDAAKGTDKLVMKSVYFPKGFFFKKEDSAWLRGDRVEQVKFKDIDVSTGVVTLYAPLGWAHKASDCLEFPAAGWSGNPIIMMEGTDSQEVLEWTFGHELGHSILRLKDLDAATNIMHFSQGKTDNRVRYKPEATHYESGTENQWQTIPR